MRSYLNILIFILLMSSCSEDEEITYGVSEPEIDQNTGTSDNYVKDILKEKNYDVNKFFVGAALNTNQLNTYVENIFLNEFNIGTTIFQSKIFFLSYILIVFGFSLISFLFYEKRMRTFIRKKFSKEITKN